MFETFLLENKNEVLSFFNNHVRKFWNVNGDFYVRKIKPMKLVENGQDLRFD